MQGIVLVNDQYWINDSNNPPVGYGQMRNPSIPVWWLRGGGSYRLATDYDVTWTIQKSKYENSGQSVAPTTTYPGITVNRSDIMANLNGNATTADIATVGVRDYNNANNTIKIGWSGADLDANTLFYVAGYTSDMKIHTASKDGVRSWIGLGNAAYKKVQSLSAVGHSDWKNQSTDDGFIPTMAFMAFWNGAFNGSGNSNLQYCDRGRFGTIVTKNSEDYAAARHTHSFDSITGKPSTYTPSVHTHDDRYYTESEMNAKLAEKSNTDHTHNIIKDIGDGRNIKIAYSKSGLDYGNYSWLAGWNGEELRAVNKNQFATADHTHNTSSIGNGNVNYAGWAGPIESAHIDVLRANRLAFLPASGVKVEYSVDSGATWIDYGATDAQKASLFAMRMGHDVAFYTGKHTKADECTTKDQLRITVTPVDRYASVNMLYLWVSVAGTSATVNISRSTIGAKETFTDVRTDVPISGWSGPNEIRFSQGTFGGYEGQNYNAYSYRFTFKNKEDGKGSISVMDIRMYGPSAWGVPNNMMEKDHIYNWDANQNVHFPAQVTATKFNGSSTGVVDYGDSNGSTIKVGYQGAGLTRDNLKHIAGYAKDGNQTVIKDVDRGVLQSWLNLNEMINTQLTTGSSTPSDNDFYISQYAGGGATTTTYHRRPISALWNYIKSKADAVYSAKSHTHTKSQITDFPASLKNPTALTIQTNGAIAATYDGSAAKTVNITKGNIGLGNVDNTADKDKNVKFATSAGSATNTQYLNNDSQYMRFHWNGQSGQPTWLWGGNDASNMYVYNPSNFSVNYATTAGTALTAKNLPYSITYEGSYVGTAHRDFLYTRDPGGSTYATETNPIRTTLSKEYDVVVFLDAGKNGQWGVSTSETCPERIAFLRLMQVSEKFTESYVVMSALTSDWTRGLSKTSDSSNVNQGPVIEYGYSPKMSIKYRKNGTTIERYWTREKLKTSSGVEEPGTADNLNNGAYMLLDRAGRTYHVFGIDIDHRFFTAAQADEEGSEVV